MERDCLPRFLVVRAAGGGMRSSAVSVSDQLGLSNLVELAFLQTSGYCDDCGLAMLLRIPTFLCLWLDGAFWDYV
jgi:hypothetical protein